MSIEDRIMKAMWDKAKEKTARKKELQAKPRTMLTPEIKNEIACGRLPNILGTGLIMAPGEFCCFGDYAYTFKDKEITVGYTNKQSSVSVRVAKGISIRSGGGGGKPIKQMQRVFNNGILYATTKRVIFMAQTDGFDKPIEKITTIQGTQDGVFIQIGAKSYNIIMNTHRDFIQVMNMIWRYNHPAQNNY